LKSDLLERDLLERETMRPARATMLALVAAAAVLEAHVAAAATESGAVAIVANAQTGLRRSLGRPSMAAGVRLNFQHWFAGAMRAHRP
jgi:hypothetical protein